MKILVLNGSPKIGNESATLTLCSYLLKGINANQEHNIEIINVIEKDIAYCSGCLSCWIREDGKCIIQDDMNEILEKMNLADMIIWSFPLYEYGIPAPLKTLIDRTNPFLKFKMYTKGERVFNETIIDITKKKNIVLCGCGFPYFESNFAALKIQMENILINPTFIFIYESGLILVPDPKLETLKKDLFMSLQKAGEEYNQTEIISSALLDKIQKPLLPNDIYINIINSMVSNN